VAKAPVRWTEVTPSQFSHEAEGLNIVRELLPQTDPFRAWSNFEFRDRDGRRCEVNLLVIGLRRIHLVELKYYSGLLRGNDQTWLRDGHRAEDSPLKLTRRKAQHRDQAVYYQYKASRARRTLRGIDEQVRKAEQAVAGR